MRLQFESKDVVNKKIFNKKKFFHKQKEQDLHKQQNEQKICNGEQDDILFLENGNGGDPESVQKRQKTDSTEMEQDDDDNQQKNILKLTNNSVGKKTETLVKASQVSKFCSLNLQR